MSIKKIKIFYPTIKKNNIAHRKFRYGNTEKLPKKKVQNIR